ncbi:hypothetical protein [Variovorax soli]|uniref:hypothetical protein n=1 Tax=Variovorax soli TaxID=376815 RepID=UPI00286B6314|nr:hypothetical protein [Variovorax soli]
MFDSRADYERGLAARGASEEFRRARQSMHTLLERFERHLQQEVQQVGSAASFVRANASLWSETRTPKSHRRNPIGEVGKGPRCDQNLPVAKSSGRPLAGERM